MKLLAPGITAMDSPFLSKDNTGLGNVLFQLATAYGLARETGCKFSSFYLKKFAEKLKRLFDFHHGETIFKGFLEGADFEIEPTEIIYDHGGKKYDPTVPDAILKSSTPCIKLDGYFECPLYFHKYRDDILRLINPTQLDEFIRSSIPPLFDSAFTPVSLHLRIAHDAIKFNNGYYKNAVEIIQTFVENPFFFFFIDDVNRLPFTPESIGIKNYMFIHCQEDFVDLFIMSYCKHHIVSNSTFSWWGSYLCTYPEKRIFVSREAAAFSMRANNLTEEEYLHKYFLGDTDILPNT